MDVNARMEKLSTPEPNTGCWLWLGSTSRNGYGSIKIGGRAGKLQRAHRVAWSLMHGGIPVGAEVCHRCDQPGCVNPAHLFVGTKSENMRDMGRKGRSATQRHPEIVRGERQGSSRLTADAVRAIRRRAASGERHSDLAAEFGVRRAAISHIVCRRNWRHLED